MGRNKELSEARQRILRTADRLFCKDGIRAVGIDRIIAEAGVAKMTLYSHFASKDDLILAVLAYREKQVVEFFTEAMTRNIKKIRDLLLAFLAALHEFCETPDFRGCAFINATVELSGSFEAGTAFARETKQRFQAFLHGIIQEKFGRVADDVVNAIALLVEGSLVTTMIQHSPKSTDTARDAAQRLVHESTERRSLFP